RSRRWEWRPQLAPGSRVDDAVDPEDPAAALVRLRSREHRNPIEYGCDGGYLTFSYDHGLGDGRLPMNLLALMSRAGGSAAPDFGVEVRGPVVRRLAGVARTEPVELGRAVAAIVRRDRDVGHHPVARTAVEVARGVHIGSVTSAPGLLARLDETRRARRLSRVAVVTHYVQRGLSEAGVPMAGEAEVLVDLRRDAGWQGPGTLANLFSVVAVPVSGSIADLAAALAHDTEPVRAVPRSALSLALRYPQARRMRRASAGRPPAVSLGPDVPVRLTVTDLSGAIAPRDVQWAEPEAGPPVFAISIPPATGDHLALGITATRGHLHLTLTGVGDRFDRSGLCDGLDRALAGIAEWLEAKAP
ncbi:hypothetical protein, partial [Tsukamurella sp. 8J]